MKETDSFEEFEKLVSLVWPKELYTRTNMKDGNPLRSAVNEDLAMVMIYNAEPKVEKGLSKIFQDRFPEMEEVEDVKVESEGRAGLACLSLTVGLHGKSGEKVSTEIWIYRLRAKREDDAKTRARNFFNLLKALKDNSCKNERKRMAMPIPESINVMCRIRERVELERGFRCWDFGLAARKIESSAATTVAKKSTRRNIAKTKAIALGARSKGIELGARVAQYSRKP